MVTSPYDMTITERVTFSREDYNQWAKTPTEAINEGAERAAEAMGWFAAEPVNDEPIHWWSGPFDTYSADVVYREKPVPMDIERAREVLGGRVADDFTEREEA